MLDALIDNSPHIAEWLTCRFLDEIHRLAEPSRMPGKVRAALSTGAPHPIDVPAQWTGEVIWQGLQRHKALIEPCLSKFSCQSRTIAMIGRVGHSLKLPKALPSPFTRKPDSNQVPIVTFDSGESMKSGRIVGPLSGIVSKPEGWWKRSGRGSWRQGWISREGRG